MCLCHQRTESRLYVNLIAVVVARVIMFVVHR